MVQGRRHGRSVRGDLHTPVAAGTGRRALKDFLQKQGQINTFAVGGGMISYHSVFNVIIEHLLNYYEKAFYYIAPGFGLFMCLYG